MSVLQDAAMSSVAPPSVAGGRHRRSLLLLPIAALLAWGLSFGAAPAAAAKSQPLHPYTGPVTRAGSGAEPGPKGPGATPRGAKQAIPLLNPDPAALRRAHARAARRGSSSGARSPQTLTPLPKAAVFGGLNKPGMSAAQSEGTTTPPDTTGAIGPSNYLEFVNGTGITAYDRELNAVSGPVALDDFIEYPTDEAVFDPQIQWDQSWGRWIYAMDDIAGPSANYLAFGWSKTADPSNLTTEEPGEGLGAGWCSYFIFTGEEFDDYPKLGHSDSGITIGTNVFNESEEFLGSRLWSIAKLGSPEICPELGVGSIASTGALFTEHGEPAFTPVPANTADSSADSYAVASDSSIFDGKSQLTAWHISGAGEGATLTLDGDIGVPVFEVPAYVPQPGTSQVIDSSDTRLTNAVAVTDPEAGQEAVWTQHTVDGPGGRSVVRWYEVLPGAQSVRQEGTISDPNQFVFNGAISPSRAGRLGGDRLQPRQLDAVPGDARAVARPRHAARPDGRGRPARHQRGPRRRLLLQNRGRRTLSLGRLRGRQPRPRRGGRRLGLQPGARGAEWRTLPLDDAQLRPPRRRNGSGRADDHRHRPGEPGKQQQPQGEGQR